MRGANMPRGRIPCHRDTRPTVTDRHTPSILLESLTRKGRMWLPNSLKQETRLKGRLPARSDTLQGAAIYGLYRCYP